MQCINKLYLLDIETGPWSARIQTNANQSYTRKGSQSVDVIYDQSHKHDIRFQ